MRLANKTLRIISTNIKIALRMWYADRLAAAFAIACCRITP
jgi:hypothetical protein